MHIDIEKSEEKQTPGKKNIAPDSVGEFSVNAAKNVYETLLSIIPYKNITASLLSFRQVEQSIYLRIAVESMVLRDMMNAVAEERIRHVLRLQKILLSGAFTPEEFYQNDSALHRIWFHFIGVEELICRRLYGGIKRLGERIRTEFSSYFIFDNREVLDEYV